MGSEAKAGTAAMRAKPTNDRSRPWATMMFCGLPIIVPAAPVLDAKQKPRTNGTGLSPRAMVIATRSGVIATTTTSLVNTLDSSAEAPTKTASNTGGVTSSEARRVAVQW